MSYSHTREVPLVNGETVEVRPVDRLQRDKTRVDVLSNERWRLDISQDGDVDVVCSWDADGTMADVPLPEWLDEVLYQMGV